MQAEGNHFDDSVDILGQENIPTARVAFKMITTKN